ncbi:MAG: cupin domain-containing protein [Bacteroidia bacterium]
MKIVSIFATMLVLLALGCVQNTSPGKRSSALEQIFPKGEKGSSELFTGNAYHFGLVPSDTTYNTLVGNVFFEPGARSNWHSHPSGQILIITDGVGYHQIEGQPRETIRKGDVVRCPPNLLHWHGASPDTGLQQMYIVPRTERGIVMWKRAVTDEEYAGNTN